MTKAKMTMRTDNDGERAANSSVDVEMVERDNDKTARDNETMAGSHKEPCDCKRDGAEAFSSDSGSTCERRDDEESTGLSIE